MPSVSHHADNCPPEKNIRRLTQDLANIGGLIFSRIEVDVRKYIFLLQYVSRPTRFAHSGTAFALLHVRVLV